MERQTPWLRAALLVGLFSWAPGALADELPSPEPEARTDVALVHGLALMTTMRSVEAAIWPEPFADVEPLTWAGRYGDAMRLPPKWDATQPAFSWDGDPWPINVVGHGVFGSELYFRARLCHHEVPSALLFAAGMSATWEYVFEANGVRPSGLDLWYTPLAGLVLGELRHAGWRAASGLPSGPLRGVLTFVLDPLGTIERAVGAPC